MFIEAAGAGIVAVGMWLTFSDFTQMRPLWQVLARACAALCAAAAGAFGATLLIGTDTIEQSEVLGTISLAIAAGITAATCVTNRRGIAQSAAAGIAALSCAIFSSALTQGWLANMGTTADLGHGAIDLAGLALVALTGGGSALGFNLLFRPAPSSVVPELPRARWSAQPVAGALCSIVGGGLIIAGLPARYAGPVLTEHMLAHGSILVAVSVAATAYCLFTLGSIDFTLLGRAVAAAAVIGSSVSLLPLPVALLLAIAAAICAIPGGFWLQQRTGIHDTAGVMGSLLLPGAIGTLATGLFSHGELLAGWGGVGVDLYLNTTNLGVVGWISGGDIGQFSAQATLLLSAVSLPTGLSTLAAWTTMQLAPGLMHEKSTSTAIDIARRSRTDIPEPTLGGDSLSKPKRTLPEMRAYKVAYPFKTRARRAAPNFVVQDDPSSDTPTENS